MKDGQQLDEIVVRALFIIKTSSSTHRHTDIPHCYTDSDEDGRDIQYEDRLAAGSTCGEVEQCNEYWDEHRP